MIYKSAVVVMGLALVSGQALAYQQGDVILRAGAALVDPQEDSSELTLNGVDLSDQLAGVVDVSPATAGVDSNTQLGLSITYMVSDKVGFELLAATPFSHTVTANLGHAGVVKAADVKHLPPTLSAQYYLMGRESPLQIYAGIGLNYTTFFDEEVDAQLDGITSALGLGEATGVDLDDSFGLALQLGCDYKVGDNFIINAAVWRVDIDTTATFSYAGGNRIETEVGIDPMVYMVGAGYLF